MNEDEKLQGEKNNFGDIRMDSRTTSVNRSIRKEKNLEASMKSNETCVHKSKKNCLIF